MVRSNELLEKATEGADARGISKHVQGIGYRAPVLRNLDIDLLSSSPIKDFYAVHCSRTGRGTLSRAEASRKSLVCITPPLRIQQLMIKYPGQNWASNGRPRPGRRGYVLQP